MISSGFGCGVTSLEYWSCGIVMIILTKLSFGMYSFIKWLEWYHQAKRNWLFVHHFLLYKKNFVCILLDKDRGRDLSE